MHDDFSQKNATADPVAPTDPVAAPDAGRRAALEKLGKLAYTAPMLMTLVMTPNARAESPPPPPSRPSRGPTRARW
ncbi:MAG: hypothetical protein P9F75_00880 [Candidatus Contendobacter sp.]|nr:hypothetical protein [Candidatus Contendobacter sp.]